MDLPKFVKLGIIELRLRGNEYYRDAGVWCVGYKIVNNVLLSWLPRSGMPWLHKQPLIEITEEEWKRGNRGYIPNDKGYVPTEI